MRWTATLVFVVTLLGCGRHEGPILVTYTGSLEGRARAELAAAEWNDVCHERLVTFVDVGGIPIREVAAGERADAAGEDFGVTRIVNGEAVYVRVVPVVPIDSPYYDADAAKRRQRAVWAHEMGHAIGFTEHTFGIMASEVMPDSAVEPRNCP